MTSSKTSRSPRHIVLAADTAQDLMTANPLFISEEATVAEAARLLTSRNISAVPVVNLAGKLVGVLSRTDIVRHACECVDRSKAASRDELYATAWSLDSLDNLPIHEGMGATNVRLVMTPIICTVGPDAPVLRVVEEMLTRGVHRLFVVRDDNLVGVITTVDVLRKLQGGESQVKESAMAEKPERKSPSGKKPADQLRQAHVKLLGEIRKLQEATAPAARTSAPELLSRLQSMRAVLGQHFGLEEGNGYMETVRHRQPHADHAIQKLWGEHRELLRTLDELIAQSQASPAPQAPLGPKVRDWITRLRAHESHENTLVQDAYNLDISAED